MLETEQISSSYKKKFNSKFYVQIFQEGLYIKCIFSKILTKTLNLHLSITVGQQYNAFEHFEVMKPLSISATFTKAHHHTNMLTVTVSSLQTVVNFPCIPISPNGTGVFNKTQFSNFYSIITSKCEDK